MIRIRFKLDCGIFLGLDPKLFETHMRFLVVSGRSAPSRENTGVSDLVIEYQTIVCNGALVVLLSLDSLL